MKTSRKEFPHLKAGGAPAALDLAAHLGDEALAELAALRLVQRADPVPDRGTRVTVALGNGTD